jgi:adenylate kinase
MGTAGRHDDARVPGGSDSVICRNNGRWRAHKTDSEVAVVLLGLPGAGKGTQAQLLAEHGWSHVNVGGMIRSEVAAETAWGVHAAAIMQHGDLLPSQDIQNLVRRELMHRRLPVVIEGYPRRITEAHTLPVIYKQRVRQIPVFLDIPRSMSIARLTKRLVCGRCGRVAKHGERDACATCSGPLACRPDDRVPETVSRRMQHFEHETLPLIAYYQERGELETVDSTLDESEVHEEIIARIAVRCGTK